ncbi:MAG: TOBE domain-containing protein, partial [Candidatus Eremiobacteraeota bacterium]|nr:TOBE domain-containing protein [Candidatus Eremiobacteraeota bacterium]MBV8353916.1 TOBE domain-containing protein [Candidatus Eremiobacteraeota bacterium]
DIDPDSSATTTVDVVELLGAEQLVFANIGTQPLVVRTTPDVAVASGATLPLAFNVARTHVFDPQAETAY